MEKKTRHVGGVGLPGFQCDLKFQWTDDEYFNIPNAFPAWFVYYTVFSNKNSSLYLDEQS